ncbi:MAG: hypothetical protein FJ254_02620 [Phycisphaerae bacterium]|nr:hypothetical protein [Phycisphaerae bacterium]
MSFELIHTSVSRDLDGQSGFGIAAMSRDLPRPVRDALVAWSDGSELDATTDRAISYAICQAGGAAWPVLTCVTRCGVDWSGRANRVAHHLVLEPSDRCIEGPIALARAFEFARQVPEVALRSPPSLPHPIEGGHAAPGVDPGWIEHLAERMSSPDAPAVAVRLPHGLDPLALIAAVTARVEPKRRWAVQWSTAPVFHAGRALPSIVIAREHDAHALDLAQTAPSPRAVESSKRSESKGAPQGIRSAEPVGEATKTTTGIHDDSVRARRASHAEGAKRTTRDPVAPTSVNPWVPIVLFAVAGVIMLVALRLLLW